MNSYHKNFRWFLYPFIGLFIVGALIVSFTDKGSIVLFINKYSTPALDSFFLFVTNIGLGNFVAIAGILFLLYRIRWGLFVLVNLLWVGIFTNLFKRIIFQGIPRPFHHFLYDDFPRFIHDAPLIYYNSFPSGHTMTIFGFCAVLAYLFQNKLLSLFLFLLALLVGISRIYLLQHFFMDVYAGAIFGIASLYISIWILDLKLMLNQKDWFNTDVLSLLKKKVKFNKVTKY